MKINNIIGLLGLSSFLLLNSSCSKDEEAINVKEPEEITLSESVLNLEINTNNSVEILSGGGDYKVFSTNEEVLTVEVEGNQIITNAIMPGNATVIVSDLNNKYSEIDVSTYTLEIALENEDLELEILLGHPETIIVPIAIGNGGYEVSTESEQIDVTVEKSIIYITGLKAGEGIFTITDSYGLEQDFSIDISTTLVAYTEKDLDEIMSDNASCYFFNNKQWDTAFYKYINETEGDMHHYGWNYYNSIYLHIYFQGDKNQGVKSNSSIYAKFDSRGEIFDEELDLEIIKNDGDKIWVVYSFIKDDKLNYGHFCQDIDP